MRHDFSLQNKNLYYGYIKTLYLDLYKELNFCITLTYSKGGVPLVFGNLRFYDDKLRQVWDIRPKVEQGSPDL